MKKFIAITMAALMLSGMAVSALADVDPSYVETNPNTRTNPNTTTNPNATTTPFTTANDTLTLPNPASGDTIPTTGLGIGQHEDVGSLEGARLTPGKEYRFPLFVDGNAVTEDTLNTYNIRTTAKKGSSTISSFSVVKHSGVYNIVVDVKTAWPTTTTDVQYEVRLVSRSNGSTVQTLTVNFETGYREAEDAAINGLSSGDEVLVDTDTPVFTKDQLEKIASVNNYRNVTFVGSNWRYTTNVSGMSAINMIYNHNGITELLGTYPNHDFEFINFPSGPSFSINGRFEVDVADFEDDFDNFYVYRYLNGNLTQLPSTYNDDDQTLTFTTNTLGRFVISDQRMNTTAVEEPTPENNENNTTPTVPDQNKYPPATGAVA